MNKELLDKIQTLNFWFKEQETGFRRNELDEVLKFIEDTKTAIIITGIRRAGKTFLARQILKEKLKTIQPEQTLFINFEDPALEPYLNTNSLEELYQTYRYFLNKDKLMYLVLDEVQNIPKWEKWVWFMMDLGDKVKFIITGSSSKIFKGEYASTLSGRTITFNISSLDFTDFLRFKGYSLKKNESYSSLSPLLHEFIEFGGFPLIVLNNEKNSYLKQLFEDIILKDIILKYNLRELEIKKLAVLMVNYFSSLISVRRMQRTMEEIAQTKISPTSINNYFYYLEDSYLFFMVPIFSYKIKEQMLYPKKVYCSDTGIINALTLKFSENIGRLYENLVAITLIKKAGKENVCYWKDSQGHEIDFVVKENLSVSQLIQVSYKINDDNKERELTSLIKAMDEFKLKKGTVITENYESQEKISGKTITFIPLWKWLLV